MGTSLTGLTPATTYDALIKVGDNGPIDGTLKALSDGLGNDLPMQASTTGINFTGTTSGLVSGVSGAIQFSNGSAFASDASKFFWDNTNKRLGVGTNAPSGKTQIITDDATSPFAYSSQLTQLAGSALQGLLVGYSSTNGSFISSVFPGNSFLNMTYTAGEHRFSNAGTIAMTIHTNGNTTLGNGTTSLGARLGIKGSGSTSATTSLLVQTSAGLPSLQVLDSRSVRINGGSGNGLTLEVGGTLEATGSSYLRGQSYGFSGFFAGMNSGENASAIIQADSTTKGFLPPRMTTTQKNAIASPAAGLQVFDSTMNATCEYNGTAWRVVSAGAQSIAASTAATTVDMSSGNVQNITLTASTTLTLSSATVGTYIMKLIQGGSGSYTVTWPVAVIWSGGTAPTLTTTVGKVDIITLVFDGTNYYGNYSLNY